MDKNKKSLPIYNAPKDILNSMQLEENNEVVEDLNKKISESTITKKWNSKYRRNISPERIDQIISRLEKAIEKVDILSSLTEKLGYIMTPKVRLTRNFSLDSLFNTNKLAFCDKKVEKI